MNPQAGRARKMSSAPGVAGAADPRDLRAQPRELPAVETRLAVSSRGRSSQALLLDISTHGAGLRFLSLDSALEPGDPVLLRLPGPEATDLRATVVWTVPLGAGQWRGGVRFDTPTGRLAVDTLLDMNRVRIDPVWALRVPATLTVRRQVMPFALLNGEVQVACANTSDTAALKALERHLDLPIRPLAAEPASLRRALQRVQGDVSVAADPENPVALCNELLYAAWLRQASDIHVDPGSDGLRVRFRVDGQLEDYRRLPMRLHAELLSRIKVLGGMDIAEKRSPQDGRFTQELGPEEPVDIRLATLPTKYGERVTLRLLAGQMESLTLEKLGMSARDRETYEGAIRRPHGLLLATGPTGCGKTTTLYAALRRIIAESPVNAITVEDPIEYDIPGVAQVEVDTAQKVSFGKALRSILRHDPDVIMIAEIRDQETVDIAMKAALTGHLVLSTLHTNSAVSAITRLDDMGVERYLTASTLRLAMAQRLARRLCPHCRRPAVISAGQARALGRPALEGIEVFQPSGCVYCAGRGYNGRIGLFELLPLDEEWSRLVSSGADEAALVERCRETGLPGILDDAVDKLKSGMTSVHEVLAAVAL